MEVALSLHGNHVLQRAIEVSISGRFTFLGRMWWEYPRHDMRQDGNEGICPRDSDDDHVTMYIYPFLRAVWTRPATLNLVPTPSKGSSPWFWNQRDCWCLTDHPSRTLQSAKDWAGWTVSWSVEVLVKVMVPTVSNDVVPASTQRCCPLRRLISSQRSSIHEPMRLDDGPARVGKTLGIGFEMRLWMTPVLSLNEELKIQLCSRRV